MAGRVFQVTTTGGDIVGFDPANDKLDLGDVSVHNFIVVDTPRGVGFMNPWSGEMSVVVGVSLGQLTIDSFAPILNDHLRQDLSGALAWEQGITPAANTVYARSHEIGQIDRVAFNPATDTVDFRYFGTREQIYMSDSPDGVIISNSGTGQALILLGVTTSQLSVENFIFHFAQVREDRVSLQLGLGPAPDSQVQPQGVPIAGTTAWPTGTGTGTPPSGESGTTTVISWMYGAKTVLDFDPAKDKLDFGWFKDHEFSVSEVNGSTVISITGNNQTYTLTGVTLYELDLNNIIALDTGARAEWQGLINSATAPVGLPTLSVADASVSEGQSGTSVMAFTVTLSAASSVPVTVSYTTLNGTATAGQDYASTVGTLTFAPGETSKVVQVPVVGDTVVELNEAFTLNLSSPVNATIADGTAIGTIVNDDADTNPTTLPAISIADLAVTEGDGDHMHFMFIVTLDKASTTPVTVGYATSSGTAISGVDFTAGAGTVTFAPGETSKMIHVDILGDTVVEADETFTVTLSNPAGATIADGTAIGTILNDDLGLPPVAVPAASIADLSVAEGNGDHVHFMFVVTLDRPSTGTVTLQYATANGTAVAGSDYVAGSGTITFAPGETTKTIHVDVIGDTVVEANETFSVVLSNPSGATIADGTAVGTIVNDDVAAPPAGGAAVDYVVRSTWSSGFVADMAVEAGSSALNGWTVEFDAGFTITNIWNAQIVSHVGTHYVIKNLSYNGTVGAGKETGFGFQATAGSGGTTATNFKINGVASGGGTDPVPVLPTLAVSDASVIEGQSGTSLMAFTVTLSAASTTPVTVSYATANGTALAGSDYSALSGTLTFAPGETSKVVHVSVAGDTAVEANETLTLTLSGASGATIADASGTGTIVNDDAAPLPTLAVADASVTEGNSGTKLMSFVVTLSAPASGPVSVAYATSNGTASAGSDYAATSGTLTFAAGETSKTIQVSVSGDTAVEANETLTLTLSAPSGATIADGTAIGTILNDDVAPLPTLAVADASVTEGNSGTKLMSFVVTLSAPASGPVSVAYATSNGTASAGSDYTAASGTLTFAAGETSKTIQVSVSGDTAVEANETLTLTLSAPSGATIADGTAIGTITNDDAAPPAGTGGVAYQVASSWGAGFTANMTVAGGAAGLTGWTVEFDAGFTITNIWNAQIVSHVGTHYVIKNLSYNGTVAAGKETAFGFQASTGSSGTSASGFILNGTPVGGDPAPVLPTLAVSDASVIEGYSGTSLLAFTVTLSAAATTPVTVNYATANGTAQAGADYTALSGALTFGPGETSKIVYVSVTGDTAVEANETLTLTLSGASGATIADASGIGTILNDDVAAPLPTLSIADAAISEGNSGTKLMTFTVTLSSAASGPVSVSYATSNGTAQAGSDYDAASGTVTFAAGETSKTIQVSVKGDTAVEANETFNVTLSSPSGATLADGVAIGTIQNDDASGALPTVSIADTSVVEGNPGTGAAAAGWLSTSGNQIVDAAGDTVQLAGVNWFGFESSNYAPHGLWTRNYKEMMDQMVDLGFNTIRLPFSSQMLHTSAAPNGIDFYKNADLQGLSALQIMDKIIDYASEIGLKIILDHHRSDAGAGTSSNGLWYNSQYTEAAWIADWKMLAQRYADEPAVIGADLHNEPYNGTWGGGGAKDWAAAAERAGNAIGSVNTNWLIFVEGVGSYDGNNYWWGGNLEGVRDRPVSLDVDNKLVYSAHDYPNSVYNQPWFQSSDFAAHLPEKFDEMWGYIYREGIAPVYIGEFGTNLVDPKDAPWLEAITSYIAGDFDNDGTIDIPAGDQGLSWTFWSWNPNSGDTGGILASDWRTVNTNKMAYLEAIKFDFDTDVPGAGDAVETFAVFQVTLSAPSAGEVTVHYHTMAGTADASDFTPATGSVTFAAGETTKDIRIAVTPDMLHEADESFSVMLMDASGALIGVGTARGTILNDDAAPAAPVMPVGGAGGGASEADLEALLSLVDSWGSGFNASVVIHNEGAATSGWVMHLDMPFEITSIWNAEIVSQDDEGYVIRNAAWNGALAADGTVSFGFTGTGTYDPSQVDFHF